jgi:signal transduction histidine kinase
MIVLAFLVPLAIAVQHLARERAMSDAERHAAVLVAVLAVTTDHSAVERAVEAADGDRPGRTGVHGLPGGDIGVGHAPDDEIALAAGQHQPAEVEVPGGVSYLEPVDLGTDGTSVVEIFVTDAEMSRGVAEAWWALGGVALFLMAISVLTSDRLAARVVRSARGLADGARALGAGDLSARIAPQGPREMAEAAAAFNAMADRVTELMAAERELIADLSHRLRTPLTALRLEAERARVFEPDGRLALAVEAMEREVDHLINTARKPTEVRAPEPDHCDASEVVRDRMAFWMAVADDQSRPFAVFGAQRRAPVPLARSELVAALDALLGNVFRYTPQGTAFEVAVSRRDGYVALRVDDAGPGIPDPDRALRRGSSDRGSTGLGLDIVRRAAIAGQGSVDIGRSSLGGTSVVVLLADAERPVAPPRPRLGFVGRLAREPDERPWRLRLRPTPASRSSAAAGRPDAAQGGPERE